MWGRTAGPVVKIWVDLNFSIFSTLAFRMEKVGNCKVYLAVVSAKQQSGLILKLLIAFGLVSLAVGNSQHAKGNEARKGEKLHSLGAYLAPALQGLCPVLASSSTPWWENLGEGQHRPRISSGSLASHLFSWAQHILAWGAIWPPPQKAHVTSSVSWVGRVPPEWAGGSALHSARRFRLVSQRETVFQLNSKQLDSQEKTFLLVPCVCLALAVSVLAHYYLLIPIVIGHCPIHKMRACLDLG